MAGPRPMQPPPNYGQQPQVVYVQQPQKSGGGFLKGCLIGFLILFVLGGLGTGAAIYFGMGAIKQFAEQFSKETDAAKSVSDDFMARMAKGDLKAAYALCESDKIKDEDLESFAKSYNKVLKDNTGVTYVIEKVPFVNIELAGAPAMNNNDWWVQLFPAAIKGEKLAKIRFTLHRKSGESFKIQGIDMMGAEAEGDLKSASIGSDYMPNNNYKSDR